MLGYRNNTEGIPVRLYRSPDEIRAEMRRIAERIRVADEQLNIRNMMMSVLTDFADAEPRRWIPELEEALAEAREALADLSHMEDTLQALAEELADARWAVRQ